MARGWLIYELTDSTVQLGLVRGIQIIPFLLLLPIAGSVADRYSRKTQLMIAQTLHALVLAATALLIFADQIQPWHVYVTAVLVASAQVFQQPSRSAMVSDAVPREYVTNAIGITSMVFNVARTVGPALAGALIVAAGTGGAYAAQALCLLLATLWTAQLDAGARREHPVRRESFAHSIVEGWAFSWRSVPVRAGLMCTMIAAFFIVCVHHAAAGVRARSARRRRHRTGAAADGDGHRRAGQRGHRRHLRVTGCRAAK